ncbi:MAG: PGPGW domain-containing protein [Thermodesulfovibrionales bacterium]|nr:PGPGW domain-containing protein [Thermodesulfovibrionales bacterium]
MIKTLKQAKRLIKIVIGFTILFMGLAMTVLPGPAIIVIPAGLAILATEFIWARRLLERIKHGASKSPFCQTSRHVR